MDNLITKAGAAKLRAELDRLLNIETPRIIQAIAEAREHGDLKENSEFHSARELQRHLNNRIQEITKALSRARVIDVAQMEQKNEILFGATVYVKDIQGAERIFQIVGMHESEPENNKISIVCPLAQAMLYKSIGETFVVKTDSYSMTYHIMDIQYK